LLNQQTHVGHGSAHTLCKHQRIPYTSDEQETEDITGIAEHEGFQTASCCEPRNRTRIDIVAAGDVGKYSHPSRRLIASLNLPRAEAILAARRHGRGARQFGGQPDLKAREEPPLTYSALALAFRRTAELTIRGGGKLYSNMAPMPTERMGPPPGASPPMRMTASWSGSKTVLPHTSLSHEDAPQSRAPLGPPQTDTVRRRSYAKSPCRSSSSLRVLRRQGAAKHKPR
jgi:hypothetical protein